MNKEAVDWRALFADYQADVEWPTVAFLPQVLSQFPGCKDGNLSALFYTSRYPMCLFHGAMKGLISWPPHRNGPGSLRTRWTKAAMSFSFDPSQGFTCDH